MSKLIEKILTANDTGETGSHQAGLLVPKRGELLDFFPKLLREEKNPRVTIPFKAMDDTEWKFNFIYYNNKFFGGTRNEYRLTCMTKFIVANNLKKGDVIVMSRGEFGNYEIGFRKSKTDHEVIKLTGTWKVIKK